MFHISWVPCYFLMIFPAFISFQAISCFSFMQIRFRIYFRVIVVLVPHSVPRLILKQFNHLKSHIVLVCKKISISSKPSYFKMFVALLLFGPRNYIFFERFNPNQDISGQCSISNIVTKLMITLGRIVTTTWERGHPQIYIKGMFLIYETVA